MVVFSSLKMKKGEAGNCGSLNGLKKSAGPPSCYSGEPAGNYTCAASTCHTDFALNSGTANLNLSLGGADSGYVPNQTYTIKISLAQSGLARGGFQITAIQDNDISTTPGTITLTEPGRTQRIDSAHPHNGPCPTANKVWVEHTSTGIDDVVGDSISWKFNWQAPATDVGSITFYLAGIDANGDLENSGDYVYTLNKTIPLLTNTASEELSVKGIAIYPTVFTDQIHIDLNPNANLKYKIVNTFGETVLVGNIANGSNLIHTEALASGVYFIELEDESRLGVSSIKKIFKW